MISLLSFVTTFMKPLTFLKGRKICINRPQKEEERAGLFGKDCNRIFTLEKLIQANLKIPDSIPTVLQVCFLDVSCFISFYFS